MITKRKMPAPVPYYTSCTRYQKNADKSIAPFNDSVVYLKPDRDCH